MTFPLANIRVLALEQAVAAPFASRHLADLGADVIKIERPGEGDFARRYDSSVHGASSYFVWLNRAKRSLTLDFKSREGRALLDQLIDGADIFITNLSQDALERAGLTPAAVRATRPRLIYCAISGYGARGPYRDRKAYDLLLQGESGLLMTTGAPDAPAKIGVSLCDIAAGVYAVISILGALLSRAQTGNGAEINISMLEAAAEWMGAPLYYFLGSGKRLARAGMRHNLIVPYGSYRCGDGEHINLAIQNENEWTRFCEHVLQRADFVSDARFARNQDRLANRAALEALIEEIFARLNRAALIERLEQAEIAWGDVNEVNGLAAHPQLRALSRWFDVNVNGAPFEMLAPPLNIGEMPRRAEGVPNIGQHTDEILRELGYADARIHAWRQSGVI